ncbi:MAG TPA: SigE family RNA polymerase sigma factor [Nocardioides sp.]|nr:SigE family RNA polymerase sigma factor [Nocardioides sp.]
MTSDFEAYVEARTGPLLRLAYLLTGDRHLAEDLVQEALGRAHRRWSRIQQTEHPHAYVCRMIINQHVSWRRRRSAAEIPLAPTSVPERSSAAADDRVLQRDATWRALQRLPDRQRAVLVLRYYEDLTDAEIAVTLDAAVGTVRSLAARAFARLREDPSLAGIEHDPITTQETR